MPSLPVLHSCLKELVQEVVDYDPPGTILNFLLSTGPHVLWVYSWPGRRPGSATWNGLHYVVKSHKAHSSTSAASTSVVLSDDDYRLDVRMSTTAFRLYDINAGTALAAIRQNKRLSSGVLRKYGPRGLWAKHDRLRANAGSRVPAC